MMGTLTRAEMVERIFKELGLNKRESQELVDNFFEAIGQSLENNQPLKLSEFGNFILRNKRERPGRNPKTGTAMPIKARRVVAFKPGPKLKARVAKYTDTQS